MAPATITRYRQVARDFLRSLGSRAEVRLEALTTEDFTAFRDQLLAKGLTPHSVNLAVRKVLKRPFKVALDQGFIGRNPVAGVRPLRSSKVEKHVFRPEQVARLCAAAGGGLPFSPNAETRAAMEEARRGDLESFHSVEALMADLNADD